MYLRRVSTPRSSKFHHPVRATHARTISRRSTYYISHARESRLWDVIIARGNERRRGGGRGGVKKTQKIEFSSFMKNLSKDDSKLDWGGRSCINSLFPVLVLQPNFPVPRSVVSVSSTTFSNPCLSNSAVQKRKKEKRKKKRKREKDSREVVSRIFLVFFQKESWERRKNGEDRKRQRRYTDGLVRMSTAALRCFRFRVWVSSASSVSSRINSDVTSKDDCLDLPLSPRPSLTILERSLSLLAACSSQPAFERSREKGHAMLLPGEHGSLVITGENSSAWSVCVCVNRSRGRVKRIPARYVALLSCLSAISCAVDSAFAILFLFSGVFGVSRLACSTEKPDIFPTRTIQRDNARVQRLLLSVLSGPRVDRSARIVALQLVPGQAPADTTVRPRVPHRR